MTSFVLQTNIVNRKVQAAWKRQKGQDKGQKKRAREITTKNKERKMTYPKIRGI
jgi:hypothetical protein